MQGSTGTYFFPTSDTEHDFHSQAKVLLSQLFYFSVYPPPPPPSALPPPPPPYSLLPSLNCSRLTSEVTGMGTL